MKALSSLRNIGPHSQRWMNEIGIHDVDEFLNIGAVDTYLRLKLAFPDEISWNMLNALQGAIFNIPWDQLPEKMKRELRRQATT